MKLTIFERGGVRFVEPILPPRLNTPIRVYVSKFWDEAVIELENSPLPLEVEEWLRRFRAIELSDEAFREWLKLKFHVDRAHLKPTKRFEFRRGEGRVL